MSQLVQFMRIHVHDAWFDVDTTRDRVPSLSTPSTA